MEVNKIRLGKYLRANGGLSLQQSFIFALWSFTQYKRSLYFYYLCEDGDSNLLAFNKAKSSNIKEISNFIDNRIQNTQ